MSLLEQLDKGDVPESLTELIATTLNKSFWRRDASEGKAPQVTGVVPSNYRLFQRHRVVYVDFLVGSDKHSLAMAFAQDEHFLLSELSNLQLLFQREFATVGPHAHPLRDRTRNLAEIDPEELAYFMTEFALLDAEFEHQLQLSFEHFLECGAEDGRRYKANALAGAEDEIQAPTLTFDDGVWSLRFNTLCTDNKIYRNTIEIEEPSFAIDREIYPIVWPIFRFGGFGTGTI